MIPAIVKNAAHKHHVGDAHNTALNSGSGTSADQSASPFASTLAAMLTPSNTPAVAPKAHEGLDSEIAKSSATSRDKGTGTSTATRDAAGASARTSAERAEERAATSTAASAASVTEVNSNADALNPAFRARLARVVDRMQSEYGYNVSLIEGSRSQARQDYLYEQGRTRPGDVVTWTKSSKHTLGLAADLQIDGSYDNPAAYQRLAQVAAQEGLRTLGARDPGHVEFPTRAGAAAWGGDLNPGQANVAASRALGMTLAHGLFNSEENSQNRSAANADRLNGFMSRPGRTDAQAAMVMHASGFAGGSGAFDDAGSSFSRGSQRDPRSALSQADATQATPAARVADVAQVAAVAHVAQVAHVATPGAAGTGAPAEVAGSSMADRVGHMLDVRDATPALPLSHMTLALDGTNGATDRIRIDLRGSTIHTAISVGDQLGADKMSLRVGELQHALAQHGLDNGTIRVAAATPDTGAGWNQRQERDSADHSDRRSPTNQERDRQDADNSRSRARQGRQGA